MIRTPLIALTSIAILGASATTLSAATPWSYAGDKAAHKWADLGEDYKLCATGMVQSPVNIRNAEDSALLPLTINYTEGNADVLNNGHTIQVNAQGSGEMLVGDLAYNLLQFHFHTPSEHYIDGRPYPMELHFVHRAEDGTLGVLAVFLALGDEDNAAIDKIWTAASAQDSIVFSAAGLLPESLDYYKYEGSLTTPPCSENVTWHILKSPVTISPAQLSDFQALFPMNARGLQPIHERVIQD